MKQSLLSNQFSASSAPSCSISFDCIAENLVLGAFTQACLLAIVKFRRFGDAQQAVAIGIKLPKLLRCA